MRLLPLYACVALSAVAGCNTTTSTTSTTTTTVPTTITAGGGTTITSGGGTTTTPQKADNVTFGALLNNVRADNNANPVTFNTKLATAAQGHADDMLAQNYFSHTSKDGRSHGDRATAAGYKWRLIGENIAKGQQSESEAMNGWTNSPPHHANNINPGFKEFGLSKAGSGNDTYWVLMLGTPQ